MNEGRKRVSNDRKDDRKKERKILNKNLCSTVL
jgi:hypothetical protein